MYNKSYLHKNYIKKYKFNLFSTMNKNNKFFIVGNWKMNNNLSTSIKLAKEISINKKNITMHTYEGNNNIELVLLAPFPFISDIIETVKESKIYVGAQTVYHKENGPYTGGVSASMLNSIGCKYVLIGHSERRTHFKETDKEMMEIKKIKSETEFKDIHFVSISIDRKEDLEKAKAWFKKNKLSWNLYLDPEKVLFNQILKITDNSSSSIPVCLVVDKNGELVSFHQGFDRSKYKEELLEDINSIAH
jgi:peroxiredoxin